MLVTSESYQNYQNGTASNQLTDVGREACGCWEGGEGAGLQLYKGFLRTHIHMYSLQKHVSSIFV
jgi:hypothetical protein